MSDKYSIFNTASKSVQEAVGFILKSRDASNPFDLKVDVSSISFSAGNVILQGSKDEYRLTDFAIKAFANLVNLPNKYFLDSLTPALIDALFNELLKKRAGGKVILRCFRDDKGPVVRAILGNKYGIMDDKVIFGGLTRNNLLGNGSGISVLGAWVSDTHSAIRLVFTNQFLNESSDKFAGKIGYGFDIVNSEVLSQHAWVKGIIYFEEDSTAMIVPNILPTRRGSDRNELYNTIQDIFALDAGYVDTLVYAGLEPLREKVVLGTLLQSLFAEKRLSRGDILAILGHMGKSWAPECFNEIFTEEKEQVSYLAFCSALLKHSQSMDSYQKRCALEFIPNLWVRRVKNDDKAAAAQ